MNNKRSLLTPIILAIGGFVLALALLIGIQQPGGSLAAPPAIPTPLSLNYSADKATGPFKFWADGTIISGDTASTAFILAEAEGLDIQYVIDQGTATNSVTLTLQFSNDGSNWVNGVAIVTNNKVDANNLLQFNNFGYRTRIYADVDDTDTDNITFTHISAVGLR